MRPTLPMILLPDKTSPRVSTSIHFRLRRLVLSHKRVTSLNLFETPTKSASDFTIFSLVFLSKQSNKLSKSVDVFRKFQVNCFVSMTAVAVRSGLEAVGDNSRLLMRRSLQRILAFLLPSIFTAHGTTRNIPASLNAVIRCNLWDKCPCVSACGVNIGLGAAGCWRKSSVNVLQK